MVFLFAFLGGLLLNLMPCVLPVLSIKVLTVTHDAESKLVSTMYYVAGILFSFFILAVIIISAKLMGTELGWGYHMQSPGFVVFLMYIFFLMGINLLGGYEIMFDIGYPKKTNMFFYGVLTTISATPCIAPFLGAAIGSAMSQGGMTIIAVFQMIALGLSLPYVVFVMFPNVMKKIPKSGNWNHSFKEFLSFPLFATSIWLLWVAVTQTSNLVMLFLLFSLLLIYIVVWSMKKMLSRFKKMFFPILILIITSSIFYVNDIANKNKVDSKAVNFSLKTLHRLTSQNKKVFVVVTANWCITCKINENLFLSKASFQKHLKDNNITYMIADWTMQDDAITEYMHSLDHSGVPLYVFYGGNSEVRILPTILTYEILMKYTNVGTSVKH